MNNPQTPQDLINTFSQPLDPTQQQPVQSGNPILNNILQYGLPTVGAVGGEILGGPVGAGVGAGGMQALADLLQGKTPGIDTLEQGGLALGGGALGKFIPQLFGKGLTSVGENIATGGLNLTSKQLDQFTLENKMAPSTLLAKYGGTGVDFEGLQGIIQKANNAYDKVANTDAPINQQSFIDNVYAAKQKILGMGQGIVPSSATKTWNALYDELQQNVFPYMGITEDENGNLVANAVSKPTMRDVLKGKQAYAIQTTNAQFAADPANYGINRWAGNILRNTLNDSSADPGLKQAGVDLMNLHDLSDLAQKRVGVNSSWLGASNLTHKVIGAGIGSIFGNPLAGVLGETAAESLLKGALGNPTIARILSAGATKSGAGLSALSPILGVAGAAGGALSTSSINNNTINEPQTENNSQNNIQGNSSSQGGNISQAPQNVNTSGVVPAFDGKTSFPAQLPDVSQISNTIPNQPYSQEQYQADINKWTALAQANPYNAGVQTQAQLGIQQANANKSMNDSYVNTYLKENGLSDQQVQFVRSLPSLWQSMNDLRGLISTQGGKTLFQSVVNDNPAIQYLKAHMDSTGQYGRMLQLMNSISEETARVNQGGPPSNFQTSLNQAFSAGNNVATNLANLDQAQQQMLTQYKQYLPLYGLSLSATGSKSINTGSDLLNNLLQQAGQ